MNKCATGSLRPSSPRIVSTPHLHEYIHITRQNWPKRETLKKAKLNNVWRLTTLGLRASTLDVISPKIPPQYTVSRRYVNNYYQFSFTLFSPALWSPYVLDVLNIEKYHRFELPNRKREFREVLSSSPHFLLHPIRPPPLEYNHTEISFAPTSKSEYNFSRTFEPHRAAKTNLDFRSLSTPGTVLAKK